MPWKCPACNAPIMHSDLEERPRLGERYRCHICRLELAFDAFTQRLAPVRLEMPVAEEEKLRR